MSHKRMSIPSVGLFLQLFLVLFVTSLNGLRTSLMNHFSIYPVAFMELTIGLISLCFGLYGLIQSKTSTLSWIVVIIGAMTCFLFVFVYLLPEAGTPPLIRWL
ncbi:hypothetical protein [Guptibacillus hwajinpoensis]|uniref:hypothetical protein n=1 Tax=Guptibacillus hwajinpoensis TaxID=208199 RepID=UPI001CFC62DF|nr:hypothetical protein [Pseudalkalibacillus hwajinpoensis]WLR59224.1 hypothetical protein LC071_19095 [Pseudalkalibacillus hwajinpoensis]